MELKVRVVPRSSKSQLLKQADGSFKAWVSSAPEKNRANEELVELVAHYFGVKKRSVAVTSGAKSRVKIVSVD